MRPATAPRGQALVLRKCIVVASPARVNMSSHKRLRSGVPARTLVRAFKWGACERAKIADLNFHDLRHEAGSRKLEAGWPLHAVSRWLGHTKPTTTDTH